ncbi:Aste57867_4442 [Aphanomyces stellatus]|uniref:Aste57867_4442 protein n=1 Tax=Aphanomyces stellatus TaxID=120398 RepID=A0A485KDX3_9STRA|nr:hypothetical protein As57867_004430 [Aphanomyces stellatus]VFT81553.1 Aste57867_4442 [Aphanomyces stellatus]
MWRHGQIVSFDLPTKTLPLMTGSGPVTVQMEDLFPAQPVCCALLSSTPFPIVTTGDTTTSSKKEMDTLHSKILSRILAPKGKVKLSHEVITILDGLDQPDDYPNPATTLNCIDPTTGRACRTSIQHVVDYTFVVEGGHSHGNASALGLSSATTRTTALIWTR